MKRLAPTKNGLFDLSDPQLLVKFRRAASDYSARSLKSKRTAKAALIRDGILTKKGRLTKNYSR